VVDWLDRKWTRRVEWLLTFGLPILALLVFAIALLARLL
jgi:hypothetical protein